MWGRSSATVAFALLPLLGLLALSPAAEGHPFHLQIENDILDEPDELKAKRWLAQSFLPTSNVIVSRVSLFVSDLGADDNLSVSIRKSSGSGFPAAMNLTWASANGPPWGGWVDFDIDPYVELVADRAYWIVAQSNASIGEGYRWWNSEDDDAYKDGKGADSSNGFTWSDRDRDYSFQVYGFVQPNFTFSVELSDPTMGPEKSATFQVNFDTGPGAAASLWVNVSLPVELTYVDDDTGEIGGVRSGKYTFAFTDVAPGAHSFNLTVVANESVVQGTSALTNFAFEATDHNGVPLPSSRRQVSVEFVATDPAGQAWFWGLIAILGVGLAGSAYVTTRRRPTDPSIEEIFVVDRGGTLLAHRSKTLTPDKDEDVLAAMLNVVQDFVRESFSEYEDAPVRSLQWGHHNILMEHGPHHYVAVVYRGKDDGSLANQASLLSRRIEEEFGGMLASWSGMKEEVSGIRKLLPTLWDQPGGR